MSAPILVNKSNTLAMLMTFIRYGLTALGGTLLVKKGIMSDAMMQEVVGYGMAVIPGAIGTVLSRRELKKLQVLEKLVPDTIAHLK